MLKKTPKSVKAKIKSAPKQFIVYCLLFIVLLVILGFAWLNMKSEKPRESIEPVVSCLQIKQECFELEVADTEAEHLKGLSGRDALAVDQGMLFIFERVEEQCMVMRDMKFSLDIIWLNKQKKILKIEENLSPDMYPDLFCAEDTKYVLEVNDGFVSKHGLKPGTTLQFR